MKTRIIIRYLVIFITIFTLVSYSTACSVEESLPLSNGEPVTDYASLTDSLHKAGATVEPSGEVTQPFFSVKGKVITVNGGDIQVFEYADATSADTEATSISPDGSSIGTSMVGWVAPPHFYKAGKLIVLYVGESEDVMDVLENVLGQQFAGR